MRDGGHHAPALARERSRDRDGIGKELGWSWDGVGGGGEVSRALSAISPERVYRAGHVIQSVLALQFEFASWKK